MKKLFILPLLFFAVFYSCDNKQKTIRVDEFPLEVDVKPSAQFALDSVYYSYPRIKIDGDKCCVADNGTSGYYFHIYSYPSFKYLKSLAYKGHSTNELIMLTDFCFKNEKIYALCGAQNVIKVFGVNDCNDVKIVKLSQANGYISFDVDDNENLWCNALEGDMKMHKLNMKGEIVDSLVRIPDVKPSGNFTPNILCASVIRSHGGVVAIASNNGDKIEILSGDDSKSLITINGQHDMPEIYKSTGSMVYSTIHYSTYVDMCIKKRIYALYCGKDFSAIPPKDMGKSVKVFDLNGNPVKKYNLDVKTNYSSIYADENAKKIYLTVSDDEKQIYVFDM